MNIEMILPLLFVAMVLGLMVWMWTNIICDHIQRRRDRETVRQQCREAREKIMADGKIEGPKGTYKPERWANKWVAYSRELPSPRPQSQHFVQFPEMPTIPAKKDE